MKKINSKDLYKYVNELGTNETTGDEMPNWRYLIDYNFEYLNKTIYQLIDEVNKLKESNK